MIDYPARPNPLGPIPGWVKEKWQGDKPYPVPSLAERNAKAGEDATNRRAAKELHDRLPDFEKSNTYERVYIDRSGGVYRLQTCDIVDAIFSSRETAGAYIRSHGYTRLPSHDTIVKVAYERGPNR